MTSTTNDPKAARMCFDCGCPIPVIGHSHSGGCAGLERGPYLVAASPTMTSTTPPAPTVRDIAYLVELVNEARDYAREIGLRVGMVAIHGLSTDTLEAFAGDPFRPFKEVKQRDGYVSTGTADGTVLFSTKDAA